MKRTKFQRVTALLLAVMFLFCGGSVIASANNEENSTTDKDISDIAELLNAISYSEYFAANANVDTGDKTIYIDGTTGVFKAEVGIDAKTEIKEFDGKKVLVTPDSGTVTWTIPESDIGPKDPAKKYNIIIEYYPIENKSASVERIFMINGEVPFKEARYLTISRLWKNVYPDAILEIGKKETEEGLIAEAEEAGLEAEPYTYTNKKGKEIPCVKYKMPTVWTEEAAELVNKYELRFFVIDIDKNEIRSSLQEAPDFAEYTLKDSNGFYSDAFQFVIGPDAETGKATISLEAVNEPIAIKEIRLIPVDEDAVPSYDTYRNEKYGEAPMGDGYIKIEAEYTSTTSSQTIYPVYDGTSAINSPTATDRTLLNTLGGDKWQSVGQWIEYEFVVSSSGMYNIAARFKQSILEGMSTSRALMLFSEEGALEEGDDGYYNGIPFTEAAFLKFNYSSDWQSGYLTDGDTDFEFYFEEGVKYRLRLEVTLGSMGEIIQTVQDSLEHINNDYLAILKLTGTSPDEYRDYGFKRVLPDTMTDIVNQAVVLAGDEATGTKGVIDRLIEESDKSSMTATLEKIARLLQDMGGPKGDDMVAKNLGQLKTYIGNLGTWLSDAKTQPLLLDFITIQNAEEEAPKAEAGFFKTLWHEIVSFVMSFFRNYDRMGAMSVPDENEDLVEVWLAYGRDQSNVIRNLINNEFTPDTGITVDLKLVAAATLLPSILSGQGPDVFIGLGQGEVINYAIRNAVLPIDDLDNFEDVKDDFDESAMIVLRSECLNEETEEIELHYYGLPETQVFPMMFVREDILADLGIDIPKTWDDIKEAIPVLQANNMEIGMQSDSNIFIYQMGGELFADDGMRINLDSNVALEAFNEMCELYTMYSFPYQYDFPNRFRTGEMPIGFAAYTGTYNQLKVFATEIEGLWSFYPMPGYMDENGNINNVSVSATTAIVMIHGCDTVDPAWEFMKWHAGADCQIEYAEEMVALLGPSAKHPTANLDALESLPWTRAEYEQLEKQFNNLAAVPNYPGAYIVGRYTGFAFLAAYNDNVDPVTELQSYIKTINEEITRKRQEFGLETLELGETLAQKRMKEAEAELNSLIDSGDVASEHMATVNNILDLIDGYITEDYASIGALADDLEDFDAETYADVVAALRTAAKQLLRYEDYK